MVFDSASALTPRHLVWHQPPSSPLLFMISDYLPGNTDHSKAVLQNIPGHTYTHTHHSNSHTEARKAHLSTFKHTHIHYSLPTHSQWMLFIVGIYLPACSTVCAYSCKRRWAFSPHRTALWSGDCVSSPLFPVITKSNVMLHCATSNGNSQKMRNYSCLLLKMSIHTLPPVVELHINSPVVVPFRTDAAKQRQRNIIINNEL